MFTLSTRIISRAIAEREHLSPSHIMTKTAAVIISTLGYHIHKRLTLITTTKRAPLSLKLSQPECYSTLSTEFSVS